MKTDCEIEPTTTSPMPVRTAWSMVAILFLLYVLSFVDRNIVTLLVDPIKSDLGLTDVQMSLVIGLAFATFYTLGSVPIGWLVDRYPRRRIIFFGVIVWSVATMVSGLTRVFGVLFAARCAVGAGESTLITGGESMIGDSFARDRLALPVSLFTAGSKIGQGLALLVGGFLTQMIPPTAIFALGDLMVLRGWQLIFVIVGLPGLALAFLIYLIPEPPRTASMVAEKTSYADYLRYFWARIAFFAPHHVGRLVYLSVTLGTIAWAPAFMMRVHGWNAAQAGTWLGGALLVAPLIGMPIHGVLADRLFRRGVTDVHLRYPMLAAAIGLPFGLAAFWVPNAYLAVALIAVFFIIICNYASLPSVAVMAILPSKFRGKSASVTFVAINLFATTLGPLIVAALTEHVFGDPGAVGRAIMTVLALGMPLVMLLFGMGLKPLRQLHAGLSDGA